MIHRGAPILLCVLLLLEGACTAPRTPLTVTSDDISVKIPAIRMAVRNNDRSVIPQLINDLEHEDPAVRFYAIQGLRHLTGQTLDYHYYQSESARAEAVQRWRQWSEEASQLVPSRSDVLVRKDATGEPQR